MTIEDRVTKLERCNRRWRLVTFGILCGLAGLMMGGFDNGQSVQRVEVSNWSDLRQEMFGILPDGQIKMGTITKLPLQVKIVD